MHAVIETGGKQYRVATGEQVRVEKLPGEVGDTITFDKVLLTSEGDDVNLGKPYLTDTKVLARISLQGKEKKIVVFKYKRRKGYRRKQGHRQNFTQIHIENIET